MRRTLVESRYLRKNANAPNVTIVMSILRRSQISSFEYLDLGYQLKMYLKMPSGVLKGKEGGGSVSFSSRVISSQAGHALGLVGVVDTDDDLLGLAVSLGGNLCGLALLALHLEGARTRLGGVHCGRMRWSAGCLAARFWAACRRGKGEGLKREGGV